MTQVWRSSDDHSEAEKEAHRAWLADVHPSGPYTRGCAIEDDGSVWLLEVVNKPGIDPTERTADGLWFVSARGMDGEIFVSGPNPFPWEDVETDDGWVQDYPVDLIPLTRWVKLPEGTPLPPFAREEQPA